MTSPSAAPLTHPTTSKQMNNNDSGVGNPPTQPRTADAHDAARWPDLTSLRSVFSPAFARAARLASNYLLHRLRNAA